MGYLVKEPLQVNGRAPLVAVYHGLPDMSDGLVLALASAKPEIRPREVGVEQLFQHTVQAGADDPVHHHRNPEIALLGGTWFRNLYPPCGFETIGAGLQLRLDEVEERLLPLRKVFHRHLVDAGCTRIATYGLPCLMQSPPVIDPLHHSFNFHLVSLRDPLALEMVGKGRSLGPSRNGL